ncbi:hypothetical protein AB4Y85_08350 [Microvirga sp. 2YAF29]|uniref:hypothetical protein n=1 Tax=Microvirga sp. 2YAF29 TaxID=3233031 RepID=UPI003F9A2074
MGNAGYGNHTEDTKQSVDNKRLDSGKPADAKPSYSGMPPAGPHADPKLTNPDSTPGAGTLPDDKQGGDADSSSG